MSGWVSKQRGSMAQSTVTMTEHYGNTSVTSNAGGYGEIQQIQQYCVTGWRKAISRGSIVMNPMEKTITSRTLGTSSLTEYKPEIGKYWSLHGDVSAFVEGSPYYMEPSLVPSDAELALVSNLALTKAFSKANEGTMELGTTFGEMAETIKMLQKPLKSVHELLVAMYKQRKRRMHPRGSRGQPETYAEASRNTYLEYRYGWRPLMSEFESLMQAVQQAFEAANGGGRRIYRARDMIGEENTQSYSGVPLSGFLGGFSVDGSYSYRKNVRANAGVIVERERLEMQDFIMKIFGFRCRDLPTTIWSLTPFSFVFDWWVNVGDWLQAIVPEPSYRVIGNWITSVSDISVRNDGGVLYAPQIQPWIPRSQGVHGPCTSKRVQIRRVPNYSIPSWPILRSKPLNVVQTADAVALTHGNIIPMLRSFSH